MASEAPEEPDMIDHPPHYTQGTIEPIDFIEAQGMGFHEGSAVQYIARYKLKGGVLDLQKAVWYLRRLISQLETTGESETPDV